MLSYISIKIVTPSSLFSLSCRALLLTSTLASTSNEILQLTTMVNRLRNKKTSMKIVTCIVGAHLKIFTYLGLNENMDESYILIKSVTPSTMCLPRHALQFCGHHTILIFTDCFEHCQKY